MKLRPEEWPLAKDYEAGGRHAGRMSPIANPGMTYLGGGVEPIWRWNDEPGAWRSTDGKLLPAEKVRRLVPELGAELEQRALLEDKHKVAAEVRRLFEGATAEVVKTSGEHTLEKDREGHGWLKRSGVAIHPAPMPMAMAERIFSVLTQEAA